MKYVLQGKITRENPLLEGLGESKNEHGGNAGVVNGAAGFGSQQQFQLRAYYGEAARGDDEDEENDDKKEAPKKVFYHKINKSFIRKMYWPSILITLESSRTGKLKKRKSSMSFALRPKI